MRRQLDLSKVNFSGRFISTEEALKEITPFPVSEAVLSGKCEMKVSSPRKRKEKAVCAEQEI